MKVLLMLLAISGLSLEFAHAYEPLFSYDDGDSHRVSLNGISQPTDRPQQVISSVKGPGINRQPSLVLTNIATGLPTLNSKSPYSTTTSTTYDQPNVSPVTRVFNVNSKTEPPHHWSALENYYQLLRQSAAAQSVSTRYNPSYQQQAEPSIYQVLQQEMDDRGNSLGSYRLRPILNNFDYQKTVGTSLPASQKDGFSLPALSTTVATNKQPVSLVDSEFGFSVPGASRTISPVERGKILLGSTQGYTQANHHEQAPIAVNLDYPTKQFQTNPPPGSAFSSPKIITDLNNGLVRYYETRKLPEYLILRQQQERARHQQELLGAWADQIRRQSYGDMYLMGDDIFCGPRNYVKHHPAIPGVNDASSLQHNLAVLSKINTQNQLADIPISLSAGEFPSHMGVFNGTEPTDDNYLCAATWIDESFALTLASCVQGADSTKLSIRAGEWNLNHHSSSSNPISSSNNSAIAASIRPMVTERVKNITIFPKYQGKTWEHNLALIEFANPINVLEYPYIYPACQHHSRTTLRANSCWAPVRNVTKTDYFDAGGDGETKERKSAKMVEFPVNLIANDDTECLRQSRVEFFNFQHPNMICSGDTRNQDRRARLNQTEYLGAGIYCDEGGNLSLVSILHPLSPVVAGLGSTSLPGFLDLSYYRPWIRNVIYASKQR